MHNMIVYIIFLQNKEKSPLLHDNLTKCIVLSALHTKYEHEIEDIWCGEAHFCFYFVDMKFFYLNNFRGRSHILTPTSVTKFIKKCVRIVTNRLPPFFSIT